VGEQQGELETDRDLMNEQYCERGLMVLDREDAKGRMLQILEGWFRWVWASQRGATSLVVLVEVISFGLGDV